MKAVVILVVVAFAITLAAVIGNRMSAEAMAVVIGAVVGVVAGIPASVLVILALRRGSSSTSTSYGYDRSYPPVVVIQGGQAMPMQRPELGAGMMAPEMEPRQYRVLGHEED